MNRTLTAGLLFVGALTVYFFIQGAMTESAKTSEVDEVMAGVVKADRITGEILVPTCPGYETQDRDTAIFETVFDAENEGYVRSGRCLDAIAVRDANEDPLILPLEQDRDRSRY